MMTLRDYFAGQALLGLTQSMEYPFEPGVIAKRAFQIADAMVKESSERWQESDEIVKIKVRAYTSEET